MTDEPWQNRNSQKTQKKNLNKFPWEAYNDPNSSTTM